MSAAVRLFPDMPPERELIGLEKLCLVRRHAALTHHADVAESCGWNAAPILAEIRRCESAIAIIDELLATQGGE